MKTSPTFTHRCICKNISIALCATVLSASVFATTDEEPVYELGNLVVNTQPEAGTQYQIDQQELELLGARSLEDALRLTPSVNVRYGGDGTPRMDIRGLRTRQIKLLVNGIPFNSTFDGQFDPSLIPAFAIGRIDLNVGSSSVLYGDGGMAGVIDIKTRGAQHGFKAASKLERGSDDFWLANGQVGYGDADQDFFFGYGVRDRDNFSVSNDFNSPLDASADNFQDNDERNNSDNRRENLALSYHRNLTDKLTVGIFASYLEGEYGKPPITLDNSVDDFAQRARYERVESQRGYSLQFGADYDFTDKWTGRLWFFDNQLKEQTASYDDLNLNSFTTNNTFSREEETQTQGVHAQLIGQLPTTGSQIAFSIDHRIEDYDENGLNCTIASGGGGGGGGGANKSCPATPYTVTATDEDLSVRSYAVELTQALPYELTAVVGVGRHELDITAGSDETAHSAQFSLSKPLNNITTVYGTVARKVDAPTIRQLYEQGAGNLELGFQRAKHYEAGLRAQWQRAALNIAVWQTDVDDFIERDETSRVFENRDELRFKGVDIDGAYQFTDKLTVRAALGFLDSEDKSAGVLTNQLQYRPTHKASLQAIYQFTPQWQLSGDVVRIGSQNYFSRVDPAVRDKLDSFELVNTRLKYTFSGGQADVYAGVENLFDEDYETSYGFPQPGRFVYTGINLRY
ncbi:MAG: TonB-dependent receptor [Methylophaga sp.]|uniref:TonB-dependent receptor n=1 Tax=Methylophaga sp. TaxID=2024840 RepID=UPI00299E5540|nr:TonB-dependent receptor [Methylophaga sp.]MDX1749823.1 TonB-dependent receptor [Methylophaga sp.]